MPTSPERAALVAKLLQEYKQLQEKTEEAIQTQDAWLKERGQLLSKFGPGNLEVYCARTLQCIGQFHSFRVSRSDNGWDRNLKMTYTVVDGDSEEFTHKARDVLTKEEAREALQQRLDALKE